MSKVIKEGDIITLETHPEVYVLLHVCIQQLIEANDEYESIGSCALGVKDDADNTRILLLSERLVNTAGCTINTIPKVGPPGCQVVALAFSDFKCFSPRLLKACVKKTRKKATRAGGVWKEMVAGAVQQLKDHRVDVVEGVHAGAAAAGMEQEDATVH